MSWATGNGMEQIWKENGQFAKSQNHATSNQETPNDRQHVT